MFVCFLAERQAHNKPCFLTKAIHCYRTNHVEQIELNSAYLNSTQLSESESIASKHHHQLTISINITMSCIKNDRFIRVDHAAPTTSSGRINSTTISGHSHKALCPYTTPLELFPTIRRSPIDSYCINSIINEALSIVEGDG